MTRGGYRENSGRKPKDEPDKVTVSLYVAPDVAEYLKGLGPKKNSLVTEFVRQSAEFSAWKKSQTRKLKKIKKAE